MYGMPYYSYNNQNYNQGYSQNSNEDYNQDYNHDYNQDQEYDNNDEYGNDNYTSTGYRNSGHSNYRRNEHYGNAYANYRGGYGPGMMYMSPQEMGYTSGSYTSNNSMMADQKTKSGWIRGYGTRGTTRNKGQAENRCIKQLIRCGIPKENFEKLPKEILFKLKIDYCGLCSQSFESTATAKLHYLSKSHLKAQKKWIIKRLDSVKLTSETPLKDRDLYCELCDIYITSKQHADSHYSGKPHRAIVEGEKDPKNAALLRRDMEKRYEQLIEREKEYLETTVIVKPEPPKVKEPKEGPPELCCHICKTVVTCSEQMTMHLNGKKHLSKEKQYILNTMKGVVQEEGDKATYTQETYPQDGKDEAGNEEDNGDNENFPEEQ